MQWMFAAIKNLMRRCSPIEHIGFLLQVHSRLELHLFTINSPIPTCLNFQLARSLLRFGKYDEVLAACSLYK